MAAKYQNNLKRCMLSSHFTEQDLAYAVGKHQSTISRYINGTALPDVVTAGKLAKILNVRVEDIWKW